MGAQRRAEPGFELATQQGVESPGALLDRNHVRPHGRKGVAQGAPGPVITLVEFGDENEAGAGVGGRHARIVIP